VVWALHPLHKRQRTPARCLSQVVPCGVAIQLGEVAQHGRDASALGLVTALEDSDGPQIGRLCLRVAAHRVEESGEVVEGSRGPRIIGAAGFLGQRDHPPAEHQRILEPAFGAQRAHLCVELGRLGEAVVIGCRGTGRKARAEQAQGAGGHAGDARRPVDARTSKRLTLHGLPPPQAALSPLRVVPRAAAVFPGATCLCHGVLLRYVAAGPVEPNAGTLIVGPRRVPPVVPAPACVCPDTHGHRFLPGTHLAGACENRTHPGHLSMPRNGFEAREHHQTPSAPSLRATLCSSPRR